MTNKQFFAKIDEILCHDICDGSICKECFHYREERVYRNRPHELYCNVDSYQFGFPDGCSSYEGFFREED